MKLIKSRQIKKYKILNLKSIEYFDAVEEHVCRNHNRKNKNKAPATGNNAGNNNTGKIGISINASVTVIGVVVSGSGICR